MPMQPYKYDIWNKVYFKFGLHCRKITQKTPVFLSLDSRRLMWYWASPAQDAIRRHNRYWQGIRTRPCRREPAAGRRFDAGPTSSTPTRRRAGTCQECSCRRLTGTAVILTRRSDCLRRAKALSKCVWYGARRCHRLHPQPSRGC